MYRDLEGRDPVVERINMKSYLRVSTGHAQYGTLEIRGTEQSLFLENAGFVLAVNETLPFWFKGLTLFPAAYRPVSEIMSEVSITARSKELKIRAEAVEVRLNASCIITMDHSKHVVSIPVEDFAIQAVNHLAESCILDVSNFDEIFVEKLKDRWKYGVSLYGPRVHGIAA